MNFQFPTKRALIAAFTLAQSLGYLNNEALATPCSDGCKVTSAFIDRQGKVIADFPAADAWPLCDGLGWRKQVTSNGTCFFQAVDKTGAIAFTLETNERPKNFSCGLALVKKNGLYGYIDKAGQIAIPYKFSLANNFKNGFACVWPGNEGPVLIDSKGQVSGKIFGETFSDDFSENGTFVRNEKGESKFVRSEMYVTHARNTRFCEGLAEVRGDEGDSIRVAYIKPNNDVAFFLGPEIYQGGDFHDGLAPVIVKRDASTDWNPYSSYGFIDTRGKLVIKPKYRAYMPPRLRWEWDPLNEATFSDGIAKVTLEQGVIGYIDRKGNLIARFTWGSEFHAGVANVSILTDAAGKTISIDDTSHGCQTPATLHHALYALLTERLASINSASPIEFVITSCNYEVLSASVIKSSGDNNFDLQVLERLHSTKAPKTACILNREDPMAFRLVQGKLTPIRYIGQRALRIPKIKPTLPEGAPSPDNE